MAKKPKSIRAPKRPPPSSAELPATQGMLRLVRDELKADVRGVRAETHSLRLEMQALRSEMQALRSEMQAGFKMMDSKFERVVAEVARIGSFVEEQNSRNRIVMEGLTMLFERQERVESRMDVVEGLVHSLASRTKL